MSSGEARRIRVRFEVELEVPTPDLDGLSQEVVRTRGDLSVAAAARHMGISPRTFWKRFPKMAGMTYREFCRRVRVEQAAELMRQTRLPVAKIADNVGYKEAASLNRAFREVMGISAAAFRKQGRKSDSK